MSKNIKKVVLFALLGAFLGSGCIGDPSSLSPIVTGDQEGDLGDGDEGLGDSEAGDGEAGDGEAGDGDGEEYEPGQCDVPGGNSFLGALDANCEEITLDGNVELSDFVDPGVDLEQADMQPWPFQINRNLKVASRAGQHFTLFATPAGLFRIFDGAKVTLKDLQISPTEQLVTSENQGALIDVVSLPSSLELVNVQIENFRTHQRPLIRAQGGAIVEFIDARLQKNRMSEPTGTFLVCEESEISLSEGSKIHDNEIKISSSLGATDAANTFNLTARGVALLSDECLVTLDASEITDNRFELTGDQLSTNLSVNIQGVGMAALNQSIVTIANRSKISGNAITINLESENENIDLAYSLEGAGLYVSNSSLQVFASEISGNYIETDYSFAAGNENRSMAGAGVALVNPRVALFEGSTVAHNKIFFEGSNRASSGAMRGGGIFYETSIRANNRRLELINSTISSNGLEGGTLTQGGGIYSRVPLPDQPSTGFLGGLVGFLSNIIGNGGVQLQNVLRYTTIAENFVSGSNNGGAGLYLTYSESQTDPEVLPLLSLIGVLFQSNQMGTAAIQDCNGDFFVRRIGNNSNLDGEEWGSMYNYLGAVSAAGGRQDDCHELLVDADDNKVFEVGEIIINDLISVSGSLPVHSLTEEKGLQSAPCSGLPNGGPLEMDQLGEDRPNTDGESCSVGAVEL